MKRTKYLAISFLYRIIKISINNLLASDKMIIIRATLFINVRAWGEESINEFIQNRMVIAPLVVSKIQDMLWGSVPGRTIIHGFHIEEIQ